MIWTKRKVRTLVISNVDTIFPKEKVDIQLQEDVRQELVNRVEYMYILIEQVTKYMDLLDNLKKILIIIIK